MPPEGAAASDAHAARLQGGYMEDRELQVANVTARGPGEADFAPLASLMQQADAS